VYEVELKVRADHARLRELLAARDADHRHEVRQVDIYYDAPHREFAETDEALRIRTETDLERGEKTTKLTYKGPLVEAASKTREEHETIVGDAVAAAGIFEGLGFEPAATVEKRRDSYILNGYTVTLDDVAGLGEFVEVEREVDTDDPDDPCIKRVREGATALMTDVGLDPDDQIQTSYLGLLL